MLRVKRQVRTCVFPVPLHSHCRLVLRRMECPAKECRRKGMGGFNPPQTVMQGTAKVTVTKAQTLTEKTYTSTGSNENALRVKGATVTLKAAKSKNWAALRLLRKAATSTA